MFGGFALASPLAATPREHWRDVVHRHVAAAVTEFVDRRALPELAAAGLGTAGEVLVDFVSGGKHLRSTFAYLGWLCGQEEDRGDAAAALRAVASLELLHAFALMQDDVMDRSPLRRGRPSVHVRFAHWHRSQQLTGSPEHFGHSAAVLLGDLCLVWAEQMLRESGLDDGVLMRVWPRYDAMRTELAVGQFTDLVNDAGGFPTLEQVLDVARRKSGNYTVRRPLELGAAMAGCDPSVMDRLGRYGEVIGEAFQLRDDLLDVFGAPEVTGKPVGTDLAVCKATSVVVAAHQLADSATRTELEKLMGTSEPAAADSERWLALITATGAAQWIEQLIDERLAHALDCIDTDRLAPAARGALADMAVACTRRAA